MNVVPPQPKIYHITHVDNLPGIIATGGLLCDAKASPDIVIGLNQIKQDRLMRRVDCHTGICVGDCVPFYFCPRSIMLSFYYYDNRPTLTYHGGQEPIVHLECDIQSVVRWADSNGKPWAFSDTNARASYANFYKDLAQLNRIDWNAVRNSDFGDAAVKHGKQAEFLLHELFPWELVERIGVISTAKQAIVNNHLAASQHRPPVVVKRDWYF